ncbi:MAG: hypothetical protein HZB24_04940 [Desulfobacterales bacterium]|nr:hypothetical protein [Desulfobacterales bacterium]
MSTEFIVLNIGSDAAKIGASYTILGVADTEDAARAMLSSLPTSTASKVAILEKKAVIRRIPSVKLEDLTENIIP